MTAVWIILGVALAVIVASAVAVWRLRRAGRPEDRALIDRVLRLSLRRKLRLALALVREPRIPLLVRVIPPALVVYLAMPLDVIPDFIPVIGHLDDVLVLVIGIAVLLRFTPRAVLEEHLARLEAAPEATPRP
ncbi:MAG TPA: DUF1232 domain-containing protein [Dehalococcoidia bacterium]|nr:DUF1232 domain-containing protein [Dehalococcoidia bacterium]